MTWVTEAAAEAFIICQQEPQFQAASRLRSRPIYDVGPTRGDSGDISSVTRGREVEHRLAPLSPTTSVKSA